MAQSKTKTVRASEDQWAAWTEAATHSLNGNLNRWICAALDQQVDLEKALAKLEETPSVIQPVSQNPAPVSQPRRSEFSFKPYPKKGGRRGQT